MPLTMREIIEDSELFKQKFCGINTIEHLRHVPIDGLRQAVKMIHAASNFPAARSVKYYTPKGSEQPVVVFGNIDNALRMMQCRFGLTTRVDKIEENDGEKLFFWVSEEAIEGLELSNKYKESIKKWLPWRHFGDDRYVTSRCLAMPTPLWHNNSHDIIIDLVISEVSTQFKNDDQHAVESIIETAADADAISKKEDMRQNLEMMVALLQALGKQLQPISLKDQRQKEINKICEQHGLVELCITPMVVEML